MGLAFLQQAQSSVPTREETEGGMCFLSSSIFLVMGYCEQDLASLLENMPTPFSEAQVCQGSVSQALLGG